MEYQCDGCILRESSEKSMWTSPYITRQSSATYGFQILNDSCKVRLSDPLMLGLNLIFSRSFRMVKDDG